LNNSCSDGAISALLPVRNGQKYLTKLLPNILEMLKDGDELIVINDGSSDRTLSILEEFKTLDSRLKIFTTIGIGLVPALNLGVSVAANEWVARFDVDDTYERERLDQQRKVLKDDVSVVFSDYRFVSHSGQGLGLICSAVLPIPTVLSLVSSQRTAHPSAIINRKLLIESGGYQMDDYPAEDLALWLRLSLRGKLISVPSLLLNYRLSSNSISAGNRELQLVYLNMVEFPHWIEPENLELQLVYLQVMEFLHWFDTNHL